MSLLLVGRPDVEVRQPHTTNKMSHKQHENYIETLRELIDNEFTQVEPNYGKITKWRVELVELGYKPEISQDQENKFWGCDMKATPRIGEELKQQIYTAISLKDWERVEKLNEELVDLVGYGIDYEKDYEPSED